MGRKKKVEQIVEDSTEEIDSDLPQRNLTPEQADYERKYPHGHRYSVSIAKVDDPCCYVGFHDCDVLKEAEQVCAEKGISENRECVVWDYDHANFVFRWKPEIKLNIESIEVKPVAKVRTKVERKPY